MKYKLLNENVKKDNFAEQILYNRGIEKPQEYLALDNDAIQDYWDLEEIEEGVYLLEKHLKQNSRIAILVDEDCDGITSAAMLYNYVQVAHPGAQVKYLLHTRKAHGLSNDVAIPPATQLLILPDSGTNDVEECRKLYERGMDILIIDHHESEVSNPYAVVVNNQTSPNYTNKHLSGAGMVWQFLTALDDANWENYAPNYLDLAALGIVGDSMDMRPLENRRIVELGLAKVCNKAFQALLDKQAYSTGGEVNPISVAFYVVPLINALIRTGTQEEKDLLFRAFIETDETFPYTKRGGEEIQETIYERVARIASNCKAKQGREVDKAMEALKAKIAKYNWDTNRILFCDGSEVNSSLTGLIAIKLANEYGKPCVLVRENNWKPGYYGGSIRNFDNSPIDNLKDFLLSTGQFEYIQGHPNAAGISIEKAKIREAISQANEMLKEIEFDKTYRVDFILTPDELTFDFIQEVNRLHNYYGQNIPECLVAVEGIQINTRSVEILGEGKNTWKFYLNSECVVIKFKAGEDDPLLKAAADDWGGADLTLTVVGRLGINQYNGIATPQLIVSDYSLA